MSAEQNVSPPADVRALVEHIARSLVDEPEQVQVAEIEGEPVVLELRVAPGDLGKVIGRQGRTARSMRAIVGAAGMKMRRRVELDIIEDDEEDDEEQAPPAE